MVEALGTALERIKVQAKAGPVRNQRAVRGAERGWGTGPGSTSASGAGAGNGTGKGGLSGLTIQGGSLKLDSGNSGIKGRHREW